MGLSSFNQNSLTLYDGDNLEEHNLPGGFFRESDLGQKKVLALQSLLHEINNSEIIAIPEFYENQYIDSDIVIMGLDSAHERIRVVDKIHEQYRVKLVIDARSGWHQGMVFTFDPRDEEAVAEWKKTLDPATIEDVPCGAKAVAYNPVTIAGCVGATVRNYSMQDGLIPRKFMVQHQAMLYLSQNKLV